MKWPIGRYNGQRIVGVDVRMRLDVTSWTWCWPHFLYGRCLGLGPLRVWFHAAYEDAVRADARAIGPPPEAR
jgi:hypothetical protein